jgi:hypothetical protein
MTPEEVHEKLEQFRAETRKTFVTPIELERILLNRDHEANMEKFKKQTAQMNQVALGFVTGFLGVVLGIVLETCSTHWKP